MAEAALVRGRGGALKIAVVHEPVGEKPDAGTPVGYAGRVGFVQDALSRTEIAERFDFSPVLARYRREHGFSQAVAEDHRRELVRFLAMCATAGRHGCVYGMMGVVDELWHTFVIFTREYARFCDEVAGRFLHHVPEPDGVATQSTIDHYLAFLEDYEKVYGEQPPPAYWPNPKRSPLKADAGFRKDASYSRRRFKNDVDSGYRSCERWAHSKLHLERHKYELWLSANGIGLRLEADGRSL